MFLFDKSRIDDILRSPVFTRSICMFFPLSDKVGTIFIFPCRNYDNFPQGEKDKGG